MKSTHPLLHFSAGLPRFPLHVGEEIKVGEEQEKHHSVGDDDLEIERKMVLRQYCNTTLKKPNCEHFLCKLHLRHKHGTSQVTLYIYCRKQIMLFLV